MKKLLAVLSAALILLSAAACSKSTTASGDASETSVTEVAKFKDLQEAFSDVTLVEKDDDTNIYYLKKDGTYKESYKGSLLSGTWEVNEDESYTTLVLTMDDTDVHYQYSVDKDEEGYVTGISQYEGRTFTIKEYSIPENITATPAETEATEAETAAETTGKAETTKAAETAEKAD